VFFRDTNGWCPYCARVWLALEEKGIEYDSVLIDLYAKPDWWDWVWRRGAAWSVARVRGCRGGSCVCASVHVSVCVCVCVCVCGAAQTKETAGLQHAGLRAAERTKASSF
jgi:hypothetical protein